MKITVKAAILWLGSVFAGSAVLSFSVLTSWTGDPAALFRFLETYSVIHKDYFRDISDTKLLDGATAGMVNALDDPYSQFLSGDDYANFMKQSTAEYGGVGVVVGENADHEFLVMSVFPKSAAEAAGILPGDVILAVDSLSAEESTIEEIAESIRGEAGSSVTLRLRRDGEEITYRVTRSNITMPTVTTEMLTDDIGYVHIFGFAKHTAEELKTELAKLRESGAEKLVIDLRMNPGGMVDVVTDVAGQLLTGGTIVSYQSKAGILHSFDTKGVEKPLPLAILIDKNSASASEILAGAAQDKKEGVIIGETSFGKGTMQMVMQLSDDEALKLSIAEYITAAGRKIDKIGIKPDIEVEQTGRIFDKETDSVIARAVEELEK